MFHGSDEFRRARAGIAALFFFLGFQYATWTSRLPTLMLRLHLSTIEVGALLLTCGVGAAGSFPLVAVLIRKLGSRRVAYLSAVSLGACLVALMLTHSYPVALVIIGCDGIACACLDVAMNAQGAALEARYQRAAMARLHAMFSAGALLGALLASLVTRLSPSLWVHFCTAGVILLLVAGYSRPRLLTVQPASPQRERRRWTVPRRATLLLGIAMAFATVTEGAMNDWSALYLKDAANATPALAPAGIAVFSSAMMLVRVFADGWRARWGDRRIVVAGGALAGAGLFLGLMLGGVAPALIGFGCVGFGIAAAAPCIYAAAGGQGSDALAVVAAMGVTGMLAGPPVIGAIASAINLTWGLAAVGLAALLVALCGLKIRWPHTVDARPASNAVAGMDANGSPAARPEYQDQHA